MLTGPAAATCPHCGAARVDGPECPRCGVIYARARPRPPAPVAAATTPPSSEALAFDPEPFAVPVAHPATWDGGADDARRELVLRAAAPPAALAVSWLLVSSGTGHALVRTFLSMWVHELGHAVSAWFCGHLSFPGPWRTPVSDGRVALVPVVLAAALGALAWRGWREARPVLLAGGVAGLALQAVGLLLPERTAEAVITFGGDGGNLVLGALLVATVWARPMSRLRTNSLRWGFLGIGAASVVDALDTWLRARSNPDAIPLGEIEGVGLSDASKLLEMHGWSVRTLAGSYVALGAACLAVIAALYVIGLRRALADVRAVRPPRTP